MIKNLIKERNNTLQLPPSVKSYRLRKTELDDYLMVFDLKKQGMTYKRIIEKILSFWQRNLVLSNRVWASCFLNSPMYSKLVFLPLSMFRESIHSHKPADRLSHMNSEKATLCFAASVLCQTVYPDLF